MGCQNRNKIRYLGTFQDKEDAAQAYNIALKELDFPEELKITTKFKYSINILIEF